MINNFDDVFKATLYIIHIQYFEITRHIRLTSYVKHCFYSVFFHHYTMGGVVQLETHNGMVSIDVCHSYNYHVSILVD